MRKLIDILWGDPRGGDGSGAWPQGWGVGVGKTAWSWQSKLQASIQVWPFLQKRQGCLHVWSEPYCRLQPHKSIYILYTYTILRTYMHACMNACMHT